MQTFFSRFGISLPITNDPADFQPGDIVTWMLLGNLPHIGIVTNQKSATSKRLLVVHNIGQGPKLEDSLFDFKMSGHFRYIP